MDKLFYDLPENLQDKIIRMNPHPLVGIFETGYYENFILKLRHLRDVNILWYRVERNKLNCYQNYIDDDDICDVCNSKMIYEDYCENFVCWNEMCRRNPDNQPERIYQYRSIDDSSDDD